MQAYNWKLHLYMNSAIAIFQEFSDCLETPVSRKLMAASTFYYYSAEYKKIKRITRILLASIDLILVRLNAL